MFDEDYGVQSYFGESGDCDFFGDTSMSGGFASGMGEAGFVSEAFAQEAVGGSFFTEASEFDSSAYGDYFTEANNSTYTGGSRSGNMADTGSRARIDSKDKHNADQDGKGVGVKHKSSNVNSTYVTPKQTEDLRAAREAEERTKKDVRSWGPGYGVLASDMEKLSRSTIRRADVEQGIANSRRRGEEVSKRMDKNKQ